MGAAGAAYCQCQQARAEQELRNVRTADDAPAALRLVLHDAATYDADSGTGGVNGSIVLRCSTSTWQSFAVALVGASYWAGLTFSPSLRSEELGRPENRDLKDIVMKLQTAKSAIDATSAAAGVGPSLSYPLQCCSSYQCS